MTEAGDGFLPARNDKVWISQKLSASLVHESESRNLENCKSLISSTLHKPPSFNRPYKQKEMLWNW